jgi:hypothetical protein
VRVGPKGTVAHPPDGAALSLVGNTLTGERTHGAAATFFSVPPWAVQLSGSRGCGAREEGRESIEEEGTPTASG